MSENKIQVRRKIQPQSGAKTLYIFALALIVLIVGAVVALFIFSDKLTFASSAPLEIIYEGKQRIIRVPANGNLQTAINQAQSGDVIQLAAGATYHEIALPNKNSADYITIESSAFAKLPENVRVKNNQTNLMAKIAARGGGKPAVSAENGAHHYRFIGIEFTSESADYVYNLVLFGADQTKLTDVPHDLEIDRCYFHPSKNGVTRRGLALNSANTIVKNSVFEGFAFPGEETQGICGWTGTKNVKILNNYIEGGAENVMFGGSDPVSAEFTPSDIEVRGNHLNKPEIWKDKFALKTLFELKNAKRVQLIGNYLENNWVGPAFRITVRNQDGKAEFSTVEDVEMRDNIIKGANEGVNILGKDDTHPSQTLKRLNIVNNLFLDIGTGKFAEGSGYFIQIAGGEDVTIAHNTAFNNGNTATFYGEMPKNLTMRDNIIGHGNYGVHGIESLKTANFIRNNIFVNNRRVPAMDYSYPPSNFFAGSFDEIGFANFAAGDFKLTAASRFKGKATDKTDIGCDVNKLNAVSRNEF